MRRQKYKRFRKRYEREEETPSLAQRALKGWKKAEETYQGIRKDIGKVGKKITYLSPEEKEEIRRRLREAKEQTVEGYRKIATPTRRFTEGASKELEEIIPRVEAYPQDMRAIIKANLRLRRENEMLRRQRRWRGSSDNLNLGWGGF